MGDTIEAIMADLPWDTLGAHPQFDRQGRAHVTAPDGRYARIKACQVSGVSRSDWVNGLVVVAYSPTLGELDRIGFEFTEYGIPAGLQRIEGQRGGRDSYYWKAGGSRFDGPIDGAELVDAVARYLDLLGMGSTEVHEVNQDDSLIVTIGDGVTFEGVLAMGDEYNYDLLLTDGSRIPFQFVAWGRSERGWEQLEGWVMDPDFIERLRPIEVEVASIVELTA